MKNKIQSGFFTTGKNPEEFKKILVVSYFQKNRRGNPKQWKIKYKVDFSPKAKILNGF